MNGTNNTTLAKSPYARGVKMPQKQKTCQFPGCEIEFMGIGASKYCEEHRKPMYRKVLNIVKDAERSKGVEIVEKPEKSNQIIVHNHSVATYSECTCPCGQVFEVTLYPSVDIYPRFCEIHRNPYQRDRLLKSLGMEDEYDSDVPAIEPNYTEMFIKAMDECGVDMDGMDDVMGDLF